MGYMQTAARKRQRLSSVMIGMVLILTLGTGCTAHKAQPPASGKGDNTRAETMAVPSESQLSRPAFRQVRDISVVSNGNALEVWIQGSQPLEYTSIKQPFPYAVAVYLPDTGLAPELAEIQATGPVVGGISAGYADQNQTTAKIEILLRREADYLVLEKGDRLGVILTVPDTNPADTAVPPAQDRDFASAPAAIPSGDSGNAAFTARDNAADLTADLASGVSTLKFIEFDTQSTGRSDIRVTTSRPVRYETRQSGRERVELILYDTDIPARHQRVLMARSSNSAVEKIVPASDPGNPGNSRIEMQMRGQVPFRVVQNRNLILVSFEPFQPLAADKDSLTAGTNPPAETADTADTVQPSGQPAPAVAEAAPTPGAAETSGSLETPGNTAPGAAGPAPSSGGQPKYTGEKIKLDFYDTDIKNVFRILKSVSGKNFAIDRDVQGRVTLSLEDPVPWDQVMDLVLKMNGLGMTMEGNVVRIATRATLQQEEQAAQAELTAQQKAQEQKEALEPLVTEYIPINYSDAAGDIQPHLSQILTPDRGTISVDQRTNMIILTDTQAKVDQAQELIYRLDTVTPQIMIEARVVEVTKEFSRDLGVNWNFSNVAGTTSSFTDDFNVALNNTGITSSVSFFRLFGSSVAALNAQLIASEQTGDARIVSSPRVLTLDNKKAMIKQGVEIAYLERDDSGGSSVAFKNVDLLLEVTPHVTPDKRISMTVNLTKNDVAGVSATGVPTLSTNATQTELLVNNNDTVVIGGIVKSTQTKDHDGLPFLTGVPILNTLFGQKVEKDNRTELLIFLSPSIVQLEQKRYHRASTE